GDYQHHLASFRLWRPSDQSVVLSEAGTHRRRQITAFRILPVDDPSNQRVPIELEVESERRHGALGPLVIKCPLKNKRSRSQLREADVARQFVIELFAVGNEKCGEFRGLLAHIEEGLRIDDFPDSA